MLVLLKFCKIVWCARFLENVFDSYFCLAINIAYSNFTFCGAYTFSFPAHQIIAAKRAQPWIAMIIYKLVKFLVSVLFYFKRQRTEIFVSGKFRTIMLNLEHHYGDINFLKLLNTWFSEIVQCPLTANCPPTKLGEGNLFTGVCQAFCPWRKGEHPWSHVLSRGSFSGPTSILWDMSRGGYVQKGWVCPGGGYSSPDKGPMGVGTTPLPWTWDLGYNEIWSATRQYSSY